MKHPPGVPPYDIGPLDWIARLIVWFEKWRERRRSEADASADGES